MAIHTNTSAVYLCTNQELQVEAREEGFDFIFGTDVANNELSFLFESKFEPWKLSLQLFRTIPLQTTESLTGVPSW
ncbi:HindVP family restriction endonuclease [Idiomarina loihiensis]|nr:HindVP family restriction endonuclease [Idiomarina loihiensis]